MCLARVSCISFLLSFRGSPGSPAGLESISGTSQAPGTPLPPTCPHSCHRLGTFPAMASAAPLCFLPELAQRSEFTPPCLPGAGISAAIHHQSNREASGTISELVVSTLSQLMCLFLMKLVEKRKEREKAADNRCIISPRIYWCMHFSFMEEADMQIYSEQSRYSPRWINSCSGLRRKGLG